MIPIRELIKLRDNSSVSTETLINNINQFRTKDDLLMIALPLRYNANPNVYVPVKGVAAGLHIIDYAYLVAKDLPLNVLNSLILMLIVAGGDLNAPAFEENLKEIDKESFTNVNEWLKKYNYTLGDKYRTGYAKVPVKILNIIYTLIDRSNDVKEVIPNMIAKTYGVNMMSKYRHTKIFVWWDTQDMIWAIDFVNLELFKFLLNKGELPTYPMINAILFRAFEFHQDKDVLLEREMITMIKEMVKVGVELDKHQLLILNEVEEGLYDSVAQLGKTPYWKKVCKNLQDTKNVPNRLKRTAAILGINDGTIDGVCSAISDAVKMPREQLTTSLKGRRNKQFQQTNRHPNELIDKKTKNLQCHKSNQITNGDVSDYGNLHISSYRGKGDEVWCFTSEYYPGLIETKKNPHNNSKLPNEFIKELSFKLEVLLDLGFKIKEKPTTIDEAVEDIWKDDELEEEVVDEGGIISKLGIGAVDRLTPERAHKSFQKVGIESNVNILNPVHARITSLWILNWLYDNRPNTYREVIEEYK